MSVYRELKFNAILQKFGVTYIESKSVYNSLTGAGAIRFVLENSNNFAELKKSLKKAFRNNIKFSTCFYRFAPEIKYNTVILLD